ncbi:MAG: hypothetical protein AAGH64_04345 [Planctomycetota bacterium]
MNDERIDALLDGHAWPDMPGPARDRLDAALHAHERERRSRLPALVAALLMGVLVGGATGYAFAPAQHSVTPIAPSDPGDGAVRLVVNAAVFSAPTINPESHVARWSAIGSGRGPTP